MDLLTFPKKMPLKVIGFDFGTKKIGVAAGQSITETASPLPPLAANNGQPDWEHVARLIKEWQPEAVIVGIPTNMDGTSQVMTERAIKFAKRLHGRFGVAVFGQDERLSSRAALERSARYGLDSDAATIIVENWLHAAKAHLARCSD